MSVRTVRVLLVVLLVLALSTSSCARSVLPSEPKILNEARPAIAGRAFYPSLAQAGYAEPNTFSISKDSLSKGELLTLSVKEDYIYRFYYVTVNGQWQKHSFSEAAVGTSNWIKSSASAKLSTDQLKEGSNYAVVYSCTKIGGKWDCHNNKWQIHEFKILPLPSPTSQCSSDQECPMNYACIDHECLPKVPDLAIIPEDPWGNFPILMINLHPADLPKVKDIIDVAMYYTTFAPFNDPTDPLRVKRAVEMIDAAKTNGVKVIVHLGDIANPYATYPTLSDQQLKASYPDVIGDGVRKPVLDSDGNLLKYDFYDPTETIKLPTEINDISPDYIQYRAAQDEQFIQYLINYDTANTIAAWYGAEEIRYYYTQAHRPLLGEYGLQVGFKKTIDKIDPKKRPLMGSLQHNWEPEITIPYTLLELGDDAIFSTSPTTEITLARDQQNKLQELQQQIIHSNYIGLVLENYGATNRIESYHTIQKGLKAIEYIKEIYKKNNQLTGNNQQVPDHKVLHAPDLSQNGPAFMTAEHARHDFWSGVLDANGVLIYNYAFHETYPEIWNEYQAGLTLIKKGGLRNYLTQGMKTTPAVTLSGGMSIIPGNDYTTNGPWDAVNYPHLVLPDYQAVNVRLFRIGNTGYLIISHSYNQNSNFSVDLQDTVSSAQVVIGSSSALTKTAQGITDSFSGIDARVYKITFTS